MTLVDANKVAKICGYADGGCPTCVKHLMNLLSDQFPKFIWKVIDGDTITVERKSLWTMIRGMIRKTGN